MTEQNSHTHSLGPGRLDHRVLERCRMPGRFARGIDRNRKPPIQPRIRIKAEQRSSSRGVAERVPYLPPSGLAVSKLQLGIEQRGDGVGETADRRAPAGADV